MVSRQRQDPTRVEAQKLLDDMSSVLTKAEMSILMELVGWQFSTENDPTLESATDWLRNQAKAAWLSAADHDGIKADSPFIVFSDNNPFVTRYDTVLRLALRLGVTVKVDFRS